MSDIRTSVAVAISFAGVAGDVALAQPVRAVAQESVSDARATPVTLYSGTLWRKDRYAIEGTYRIEQRGPDRVLVLGDDFRTNDGPDLKVALHPSRVDEVTKRNALRGAVVLGELERFRGRAEFPIPGGVDLSSYRSLLIHCEQYTVLWGAVPLEEGEVIGTASEWTRKNERVKGRVELVRIGSDVEIRFGPEFTTKGAPDLKVVLSPHTTGSARDRNALEGGLIVAPLRDRRGAQRFTVPASELREYRSVLIHCEQYTKLWAVAPIAWTTR